MENENNEQMEKIRHSLSHLMSMAVLEFYPKTGLGVGPTIEDGFYQDYDLPEGMTISDEILPKLEKRIKEIIKQKIDFVQHSMDFKPALDFYKNDLYKAELIQELQEADEKSVSFYKSDWYDNLCKGPHVKNSSEIDANAFKLTKIAGAYWKGDEKNKMLTRIYGIAFNSKSELDEYLVLQEEAKKRDHRRLGKELDLYHVDEMVGLGLPLWHPDGAMLWRVIEEFWYESHLLNGYKLVRSPHIGNRHLWETSGHWGFYNESMYPVLEVGQTLKESQNLEKAKESEQYLLKPMNCPFHVRIYKDSPHSYRDLPYRWAECGTVYRYEKKGELSGLVRVRGFTQDDAHIICRPDQVEEELEKVIDFILFIYESFGFKIDDIDVFLSIRDPQDNKYAGTNEGWNFTEKVLEKIALKKKLNFQKDVGGAVFYGPKLDFKIRDCLNREWQCSTLQFDFNLPERFDMVYTNEKGEKQRPYMLHRALFGSFERFIGLLIEHYAGSFPTWLAPTQARLIPVSEKHVDKANELANELFMEHRIRVDVDPADETVGNKVRKAAKKKIPYIIVVGDRELEGGKWTIRVRAQDDQLSMDKDEFIRYIKEEINLRK
ncbi:MAG: threonine--tRNA ligase [bacterium]